MVTEITKFKTSDGEEFGTRSAAEAHEAKLEGESALAGIDRPGLLADPLSPRARAFERLGAEIAAARRRLPEGKLRNRKPKEEISPEAFIAPEKMGDMDDGNTATVDIGNVEWGEP